MNWLRWQKGRQKTGYEKLLLLSAKWPRSFDVHLLRFLQGHEIPPHVDQVDFGQHHRLNIVLKQAKEGGEFVCQNPIYESRRIKYFRPDISEHSVGRIIEGSRYVLSVGWIKY